MEPEAPHKMAEISEEQEKFRKKFRITIEPLGYLFLTAIVIQVHSKYIYIHVYFFLLEQIIQYMKLLKKFRILLHLTCSSTKSVGLISIKVKPYVLRETRQPITRKGATDRDLLMKFKPTLVNLRSTCN